MLRNDHNITNESKPEMSGQEQHVELELESLESPHSSPNNGDSQLATSK